MKTSILICYKSGTAGMLWTCLRAIKKHTVANCEVNVVYNCIEPFDASDCITEDVKTIPVEVSDTSSGSKIHGNMLDEAIKQIDTELLLTLDSDCFPIASGWLQGLIDKKVEGIGMTGILHPFEPPDVGLSYTSIQYRVMNQHNWNNTHVACQLVDTDFIKSNGLSYAAGDDTGLAINAFVRKQGLIMDGYKASRCPKPESDYDAELNRYACLVFGDKVYHQCGATRSDLVWEKLHGNNFNWARQRVLLEGGAEWLLNDEYSYRYRFDREDEVTKHKMDLMFGLSPR
jgi:hypothetical protein